MNTNKIAISCIKDLCDNNDYDFRGDYSGRGMYGKYCVGIVSDCNPLHLVLCIADILRDEGIDNAEDVLGEPKMDSMGLSTIVYFPRLQMEVD